MRSLGTDGFGRSEDRAARCASSSRSTRGSSRSRRSPSCAQDGKLDRKVVAKAIKDLEHQPGEAESGEELDAPQLESDTLHANRFHAS